jgi:ubiquinone/menaquinone biosynthesis C-methylase UbiE
MADRYSHGHHESVLRSHLWRTAENSAGYLLPHLAPGQRLLDVGCGPGTITLDLARRVAPGVVLGVDAAAGVVATAEASRVEQNVDGVTFAVGDVYALDTDDHSFDVVHAHQVLQHLSDPRAALAEMRRVLVPGGLLAVRDSDYAAFAWAPDDPLLDAWLALFYEVVRVNGAEARAGRYLKGWVLDAGFTDVEVSSSTWTFSDPEDRHWWGGLWADRVVQSSFAAQALEYGLATIAELEAIAAAFRRWAERDDGVFLLLHGEVLARR